MGNTDSLPIVSQTKSLVQVIAGDSEGALETQKNFVKGCPVVSQAVCVGALIAGDTDYAGETQKYFFKNVSNMADSVPVVGHVKGAIHYVCGDVDGGNNAMKAATRTTGVAACGIGGFVVGGPVGAIAGGISGGVAMDSMISGVDTAIHGEERLYGHLQLLNRAMDGKLSPGEIFDWTLTPVFDGLTGYGYGRAYGNFKMNRAQYRQLKESIKQYIKDGKLELKDGNTVGNLAKELQNAARALKKGVDKAGSGKVVKTVGSVVIDVEGNAYTGFSYRLRQALSIDAFKDGPSSTQQILSNKFPGRVPNIKGASTGQPQCAEHHALHQFHKVNGNHAVPKMTITVQYDGQNINAIPRCGNCMKTGRAVPMGHVVTDSLNGLPLPVEDIVNKACLDSLIAECLDICDCEYPQEEET